MADNFFIRRPGPTWCRWPMTFVIFFFLRDWRSTLIPIPVSLLGPFALMKVFGFSIHLLTLFGLTLATGLVVDDAIVAQTVELLQAQSTQADARSENVNARTFWYIALVKLAHDMGVISFSGETQPQATSLGSSLGENGSPR